MATPRGQLEPRSQRCHIVGRSETEGGFRDTCKPAVPSLRSSIMKARKPKTTNGSPSLRTRLAVLWAAYVWVATAFVGLAY